MFNREKWHLFALVFGILIWGCSHKSTKTITSDEVNETPFICFPQDTPWIRGDEKSSKEIIEEIRQGRQN